MNYLVEEYLINVANWNKEQRIESAKRVNKIISFYAQGQYSSYRNDMVKEAICGILMAVKRYGPDLEPYQITGYVKYHIRENILHIKKPHKLEKEINPSNSSYEVEAKNESSYSGETNYISIKSDLEQILTKEEFQFLELKEKGLSMIEIANSVFPEYSSSQIYRVQRKIQAEISKYLND